MGTLVRRLEPLWFLVPLLAAALALASSLGYGLVSDAQLLLEENRFLETAPLLEHARHDYFWSSSGAAIGYWRPFTKLAWVLEYRLFGRSAVGFHAVQVAWLLVGVGGVMALARRLGASRGWALAGGLLFALHPAVFEPTCLVMARSDVVSTSAMIWALLGFHRFVQGDGRRWLVLHVLAVAIALGSKETAVVLLPALVIWVFCLCEPPRRRAFLAILPTAVLALLYLLGRRAVLGSGQLAVQLEPLRLFVGSARYLRGLVPLQLLPPSENLPDLVARSAGELLAALATWLVVLGLAALALRRRRLELLAVAAWGLGALAPVLLVEQLNVNGASDKIPLADRWLLPAVAAAAVILALAARDLPRRFLRPVQVVLGLWAVVAVLHAPRAHAFYANDLTMLAEEEASYQATREDERTAEDRCRHEERVVGFALQRRELDEAFARLADWPPVCPRKSQLVFNSLSALVSAGRFREARPLADELLAGPSTSRMHGQIGFLAGMTYLETGAADRALPLFEEAAQRGVSSCALELGRGRAEAMLGRHAEAAPRLEAAARCAPQASAWLMAADLRRRLGQVPQATADLAQAERLPMSPGERDFAARLAAQLR